MKKYKIIYADPPWQYKRSKVQGAAEKHYPTMQLNELCALPVAELADQDCILFLWATFPQLNEALELIKAWGFTYKSVAFVWLKLNRKSRTWFYGLGFWTRGNAEICLLATKGHPKRKSAAVHQFIISPIEQHSKKPDEAREKIIALMGDLPRIELFARQHTPGWDVWGNEVETQQYFFVKGGIRLAYVTVPKDLSKIKTKVAFNLTKRQIVCLGAALLVGLPLFFLLKGSAGTTLAAMAMIVVMLPCFLFAMYERHGQPLEVVVKNIIQTKFTRPKERPYQTENFYAVLERQRKLEKEVSAIVKGTGAKGAGNRRRNKA